MGWFVEAGGHVCTETGSYFKRNMFVPPENIKEVRKMFNNTDVYFSAYMYQTHPVHESELIGSLYFDLDSNIKNNEDYEKIQRDLGYLIELLHLDYKVPYEYIDVYFSGNKGFHVIVSHEVFNIKPCQNLNAYYKEIAMRFKERIKSIDIKIYDNKRLLRLPNSINSKTGLYKIPLDIELAKTISRNELFRYAKFPRFVKKPKPKPVFGAMTAFRALMEEYDKKVEEENQKRSSNRTDHGGSVNTLPPCIKIMLRDGVKRGMRNNALAIIASSVFQNNIDIDTAEAILTQWNNTVVVPRLPQREIINTIRSIYRMHTNNRAYGCAAVKEMGFCIKNKCRIYKKVEGKNQ